MFVLDKKYAKKIQTKNRANERVEVIEMDDMSKFLNIKNKERHIIKIDTIIEQPSYFFI